MKNEATFGLIGRIGEIKKVGSTLRVTVASNYSRKDAHGNWQDETYWNEVTIFADSTKRYIEQYLDKGDLIRACGRIRQNSYERDGQRVFTVDLLCNDFSCLAQAAGNRTEAPKQDPAKEREAADIPF
jgi:single-strand DNA-binding protein